MSEKLGTIVISILSRPKSGGSTIVSQVAHHLKSLGFEVDVEWGLDGEPRSYTDPEKLGDRINNVRERSKIIIKEKQAPRVEDSTDA